MTRQTVNVLEFFNGEFESIQSFSEDDQGNREAEETYREILMGCVPDIEVEDIESYIEDGYCNIEGQSKEVYLVHSA